MPCRILLFSAFLPIVVSIYESSSNAISENLTKKREPIYPDKITEVETTPTQLIIHTTKDGPLDRLKIKLNVIDLEERKQLPPIVMSGLFLLISRGRYTIPFLKPAHWYGIEWESENVIEGETKVDRESRVVETLPRPGNNGTNMFMDPNFEIQVHRNDDLDRSNAEPVFLTAKWTDAERVNNTELLVDVIVMCSASTTKERIVLHDYEDGVTIQISIDHKVDVTTVNATTHEIKAQISPVSCLKICWRSTYVVKVLKRNFTKPLGNFCRPITSTESTTFLRDVKSHTECPKSAKIDPDNGTWPNCLRENNSVENNKLIIETELASSEDEEAKITLTAVDIINKDEEPIVAEQTVSSSKGQFSVKLGENRLYAVTYEYRKEKPFHYTSLERFLVETSENVDSNSTEHLLLTNSTKLSNFTATTGKSELIKVVLQPNVIKPPKEEENRKIKGDEPKMSLARTSDSGDHPIKIHIEPFCTQNVGSEVTLDNKNPTHELVLPLEHALCVHDKGFWFCEGKNFTKCSSLFCYSPTVLIQGQPYEGSTRCVDVASQFKAAKLSSRSCAILFIAINAIFTLLLLI